MNEVLNPARAISPSPGLAALLKEVGPMLTHFEEVSMINPSK